MAKEIDPIKDFLDGNPNGLNQIILAYQDPLILYGRRLVSRTDVVADAVSEAFYLLSQHIGTFDNATHIVKWLHVVVYNKCQAGARPFKPIVPLPKFADELPGPDGPTEADIKETNRLSDWQLREIYRLADRLSRQRRDDFRAFFIGRKTYAEIAEERGTTPDAVRQNIAHAIKQLRKWVKTKKD